MAKITVQDILRGCKVGQIQTVGFMQVIPLIGEVTFDNYVAPRPGQVGNPGYAVLSFDNRRSDEDMIVPMNLGVITKQRAQDHALTTAAFVKAKATEQLRTAVCIQQSQPGNIMASDDNRIIVLPATLREEAFKMKGEGQLGRLWPSIQKLMKDAGVREPSGNLVSFLNEYNSQLEQFVAEFEPVENQVGAIILISGQVAGIERTPNVRYWNDVWTMLIRDCYGSLAIIEHRKHKGVPPVPRTRVQLRPTRGKTMAEKLADLKDALEEARKAEYEEVKRVVEAILETELPCTWDGKSSGTRRIEDVGGESQDRFVGQLFREGEAVVYASLVSTKHWRENEDWLTARPFKM
jgi:hypothetical protein